ENMDAVTASKYFTDVPQSHWAVTYIGWCAAQGIVSGVGGGRFDPNGQLTGCAFGKMLLVAYGHNAETDKLTGAGWDKNVAELLKKEGRDYLLKVTNDPLPRQEACQMAYNFTLPAADTSAYADTTLDLKADKALYKVYGRTYMGEDGAAILWPGNAVEFTAELGGDLVLNYRSAENLYIRTFVDGEENARVRATGSTSARKVKLATDIRPGEHTIRIVRDTDISTKGSETFWTSLTFTGVKSTVKATPQKKLLIEYFGASTLAGKGALRGGVYTSDDECHSAAVAFTYLSAQQLDADWSLVARGGAGVAPTTSVPIPASEFYDYVNPFSDTETRTKYDFARKPDVVVVGIGGNDGKVPNDEFKALAKALIQQIRDRNGADVKIVVTYNEMVKIHTPEWEEIIPELGVYHLELVKNNDGGASSETAPGHPSAAAHAVNAKLLADYIRDTVLK
ncbi:MAG: S-layer homology domain-containing protein, partial [Oscillospiraceae bacterium]|nr:S-layer homology domain-containing protein [Oscillospiraceae bacterium]